MRIIVASAIKIGDRVFTGRRHNEIIHALVNSGHSPPIRGEQGFVDVDGNFLDRKQAAAIALEHKQIDHLNWPPNLYSEDLW